MTFMAKFRQCTTIYIPIIDISHIIPTLLHPQLSTRNARPINVLVYIIETVDKSMCLRITIRLCAKTTK